MLEQKFKSLIRVFLIHGMQICNDNFNIPARNHGFSHWEKTKRGLKTAREGCKEGRRSGSARVTKGS